MNIPHRINPLGVSEALPAGYTRLAYLESTGSQYMVTDFIPSNESGIFLDCQMLTNEDVIPCGCRNSTPAYTRFYAVRPPILASSGRHVGGYGWGSWRIIEADAGLYRDKTCLNWKNNRQARCIAGNQKLENLSFTPICPVYIFAANVNNVPNHLFIGKIWRVAFSRQMSIVHDFVPALTHEGKPCMYNLVEKTPLMNVGGGTFICGVETQHQLDMLLYNLPDCTNQETRILTIRIADELSSEALMDYINSVSLLKNWNIAYAA